MKRKIALLLSMLTLAGISASLTACGDTATVTPTETGKTDETAVTEAVTEEAEPSLLDTIEKKDMAGAVYTIYDANTHTDLHTNVAGEELTGEILNDALINRDAYIEEQYNVDIVNVHGDSIDPVKKAIQAGDDIANLVISTMLDNLSSSASNGLLANLRELPYMSLGEKWWSPLMYDALSIGGAMYITASDLAPGVYQSPCCLFLNLKLYEDYDIKSAMGTDIYDIVLDGKWTIDMLNTVTKGIDNDLDGDGKWTIDDFYGVVMQPTSETANAFLGAANVSYCTVGEDGASLNFTATDDTKLYTVVEKLASFVHNTPYQDVNDCINQTFKEGRALFLQHKLESAAVHLRDMEDDYLILPDPKFDEAQETYISFVSGYVSGFIGVPKTAEPEFTGYMTEILARYSNEYLRPLAFDTIYKEKDSRDPRTAEVLDVLFDNLYIDFCGVYNFGGVNDVVTGGIFNGKDIASNLEKKRSSAEKQITKMIDKWLPVEE